MTLNPYGLADSVRYNYFAHLRKVLFGNAKVTTGKKITLTEYLKAYEVVLGYYTALCTEISTSQKNSRVGAGEAGIRDQIHIDNLCLERNAMNSSLSRHDYLVHLFQRRLVNTLSFTELIDGLHSSPYNGNGAMTKDHSANILKKTFMDEPLKLWHSAFV